MCRFILKVVLIFFSFRTLAAQECAAEKTIDSRDILGLEKYIGDNAFTSVECVLAALPTDIKAFRTYVKKSLSLQEASITNPRAIIGSPDGGFFMTFNGHKKQKGYEQIEFLALDKNIGPTKWIAGTIENINGKMQINKNSTKCTACHGNPIRPIWGKYPSWPNFYGSIDDWLPDANDLAKGSLLYEQDTKQNDFYGEGNKIRLTKEEIQIAIKESVDFRKFRETAKNNSRYSILEKISDNSSPVYPYTDVYRNRNNAFRPNLVIGSIMNLRQNEILYKKIGKNKTYNTYKSSILHFEKCIHTKESDTQNEIISKILLKIYGNRYTEIMPGQIHDEYYFDIIGAKPHERTLLFANDTDYIEKESHVYFSGYSFIAKNVLQHLLYDHVLSWRDEKYISKSGNTSYKYDDLEQLKKSGRSYFQSNYLGQQIDDQLLSGYGTYFLNGQIDEGASEEEKQIFNDMCTKLLNESKAELQKESSAMDTPTSIKTKTHPWPEALNSCIKCHDNGNNNVALAIPFTSPEKLKSFNKNYKSAYGWGDLSDIIDFLTLPANTPAHLNGTRMPLGQAPLTKEEVKEIRNWIQKAVTAKN